MSGIRLGNCDTLRIVLAMSAEPWCCPSCHSDDETVERCFLDPDGDDYYSVCCVTRDSAAEVRRAAEAVCAFLRAMGACWACSGLGGEHNDICPQGYREREP